MDTRNSSSLKRMIDESTFVRQELVEQIFSHIKNGNSVKLIGVPNIGMSTIMQYLFQKIQVTKEWGNNYFAFYIKSEYEMESFSSCLLEQLSAAGLDEKPLSGKSVRALILEARDRVKRKTPDGRVVFLLDNFVTKLEYFAFKAEPPFRTMLTRSAVEDIRNIDARQGDVCFVVNYHNPPDVLLDTDWYLNDFATEQVPFLSEAEARRLVKSVREKEGSPLSSRDFKRILHDGGRHPQILNHAASTRLHSDRNDFESWVKRRYVGIENHIRDEEKLLEEKKKDDKGPRPRRGDTIETLRRIAINPPSEKPDKSVPAAFCYEEKSGSVHTWRLFSDHFAEYLVPRAPRYRNERRLACLVLATLLLIPPLFSIALWIWQQWANRVLFIPEYDRFGFNLDYLWILFTHYKLNTVFTFIYGANTSILIWKALQGSEITLKIPIQAIRRQSTLLGKLQKIYMNSYLHLILVSVLVGCNSVSVILDQEFKLSDQRSRVPIAMVLNSLVELSALPVGSDAADRTRASWMWLSEIHASTFRNEYLTVAPLVIGIQDNFRSATEAESKRFRKTLLEYIGYDPKSLDQPQQEIRRRISILLGDSLDRSIVAEHGRIWVFDQSKGLVTNTLRQADSAGGAPLHRVSDLLATQASGSKEQREKVYYFYSLIKAGLVVKSMNGSEDMLRLGVQLARLVLEK